MSKEEDHSSTSILLPASSIAIFTNDKESIEAAKSLEDDWRFARVRIEAVEGDVETAIESYRSVESPALVMVQTDEINDEFVDQLETLASSCHEDTAAIVIGPVNDVYLYRQLIGMGVSDYLVRPVKTDVLSEVIAKTLLERIGASGSHLVAVAGSRGGMGVSTLSRMLAAGISGIHNQKAVLFDAAGGWSANSVSMGSEPVATLAEVIRAVETGNEDTFARTMLKAGDRLSIVGTGVDVMLDHDPVPEQVESLVDLLMNKFPVAIFDLSQTTAPVMRMVLAKAGRIILVSTPGVIDLRLTRSFFHEIKELRGNSADCIDLVINMQDRSSNGEMAKSDIEAAMGLKPSLFLPFDPGLFIGNEAQFGKLANDKSGKELLGQVTSLIETIVTDKADTSQTEDAASRFSGSMSILNKIIPKKK